LSFFSGKPYWASYSASEGFYEGFSGGEEGEAAVPGGENFSVVIAELYLEEVDATFQAMGREGKDESFEGGWFFGRRVTVRLSMGVARWASKMRRRKSRGFA
jgi:hypothetical protein